MLPAVEDWCSRNSNDHQNNQHDHQNYHPDSYSAIVFFLVRTCDFENKFDRSTAGAGSTTRTATTAARPCSLGGSVAVLFLWLIKLQRSIMKNSEDHIDIKFSPYTSWKVQSAPHQELVDCSKLKLKRSSSSCLLEFSAWPYPDKMHTLYLQSFSQFHHPLCSPGWWFQYQCQCPLLQVLTTLWNWPHRY